MSAVDEKELMETEEKIRSAKTLDDLADLEKEVEQMNIVGVPRSLLEAVIALRKAELARELAKLAKDREIAFREGTYFEDAINLFDQKPLPGFPGEKEYEELLNKVFRQGTPDFYKRITKEAETKVKGKLRDISGTTLGTNNNFILGLDIFYRDEACRAHVLLDSPTCAPAWGHMAEGATGKIDDKVDDNQKNQIRLLRMMGPKKGNNKNDGKCLRSTIYNFITLNNDHRTYFDNKPQLMLVPILGLKHVRQWEPKQEYEVLVLMASVNGVSCREKYATMLSSPIFKKEFDANEKAYTSSSNDIEKAFTTLGHFGKAVAVSLMLGIPQKLLDLSESERKGNKRGSTNRSPKSKELDEAREELKKRFILPKLKQGENFRPVLKLRLSGDNIPDPWLLMVKAFVNFSYIIYGHKFLPAYVKNPHSNEEEYLQALEEEMDRLKEVERQQRAAMNYAGVDITVTPPALSTPPAKMSQGAKVTSSLAKGEDVEGDWENLSD